jgi:carboxyl-terminal processing protease
VALLLIVGSFGAGFFSRQVVASSLGILSPETTKPGGVNDGAPAEFQSYMPVFWQAWDIVRTEFYKQPVDENQMTYGAIAGMVDALGDPHTGFAPPDVANQINQSLQGSFEGIGATVEMQNGRVAIVAPIDGSPAQKAGLKAGDVILKVNDTPLQNMTLDQAVSLIRGPKGSVANLTIQRGTQPEFQVRIVRDTITGYTVDSKMLDGNIGYIRMSEFRDTAGQELDTNLRKILAQKPKALIFDLRSNPGGFLQSAIDVAGEFLPANSVVLIEKQKNGDTQEYKTQAAGLATNIPMVLLVNEGSASASEILAGALKDYKRAEIIGTRTYGKGSYSQRSIAAAGDRCPFL